MNRAGRRSLRGLASLGVAIAIGVISAGDANAASPTQWVASNDGCAYLTDGYVSYWSACLRGDGGLDFYTADSGQWYYAYTTFPQPATDYSTMGGESVLFPDVTITNVTPGPGYSTMGGESVLFPDVPITNITPGPGYTPIGGEQLGVSGGTLTGNPLVDSMMIDANYDANNVWLQPTCVEIVGDTCYVL